MSPDSGASQFCRSFIHLGSALGRWGTVRKVASRRHCPSIPPIHGRNASARYDAAPQNVYTASLGSNAGHPSKLVSRG